MEFFELLRYRRSTRKFTEGPVSREDLERILTAAWCAPVGSNLSRDLHLTVVRDRAVLDKLAEAAVKRREDTAKMKAIEGDTPKMEKSGRPYDPFYGAPAVIFVSHRAQDLQPGIDWANVAIVASTMHLAATDMGLGSVLMWFALESMREIPALDNTGALGLPEGFAPLIGLAVGHPAAAPAPREVKRDKVAVDWL